MGSPPLNIVCCCFVACAISCEGERISDDSGIGTENHCTTIYTSEEMETALVGMYPEMGNAGWGGDSDLLLIRDESEFTSWTSATGIDIGVSVDFARQSVVTYEGRSSPLCYQGRWLVDIRRGMGASEQGLALVCVVEPEAACDDTIDLLQVWVVDRIAAIAMCESEVNCELN